MDLSSDREMANSDFFQVLYINRFPSKIPQNDLITYFGHEGEDIEIVDQLQFHSYLLICLVFVMIHVNFPNE